MPLHSADREAKGGVPPGASHFLTRIVAADALLIAFPEHNGHFPAAFKNLFDSASRANATVFQEKPMAVMADSPGPRDGIDVLGAIKQYAPFIGADIRRVFGLGTFQESLDRYAFFLTNTDKQAAFRKVHSALALGPA